MRKDGKRFSLYLIAALILVSIASFMMLRSEAGGLQLPQDSDDYYLIATSEDLKQFREAVNAGSKDINAKLTANIDLEGTPGKNQWTPIRSFNGKFDGGGFTISGLYISAGDHTGFIGTLAGGAEVSGLTIEGTVIGGITVGGIVGENNGTVKNCALNCEKVSSSGSYVGGIVGYNNGTVKNCASNCETVDGGSKYYVGGIVGYNKGTVTNCASNCGAVSAGDSVGGVVGRNDKGTVTNCASNCGAVSGSTSVGGVVGYNNYGTVTNCASNCETVSGSKSVGGVVGQNYSGTVTNCASNCETVSGSSNSVGGVVGYNNYSGTVTNCGWLAAAAPNGIGGGDGTADVVSYDAVASETVVTACVSPLSVMVAKDRSAVVPFALAPGADASAAMYIEILSADVASAGIASADVASGKVTVTGLDYGTTAMAVSYKFKYTDFSTTPLSVSADQVEVSANVGITVHNFAVTPESATIAAGGTSTLTASGGSAAGGVTWAVSGDAVSLDKTAVLSVTATGVRRGTATVTATTKDGETASCEFTVIGSSLPKAEVTAGTRTDTTGAVEKASGIVVIGGGTIEDFAVYDGFDALAASNDLPGGITASSVDAITKAQSKDIEISSRDIFSDEAIKKAIGAYWRLGETSADKVHMVQVRSATGETQQSVFAKIWRLLASFFGGSTENYDTNKYLPLQTNFVISSADVAELPEYVRSGLTKDNLLTKLDLFVLVKSGDAAEPVARSLNDITKEKGWISVAGDNSNGYLVKTRLLVFDQIGGVKAEPGAKWVQKFAAKSADKVTDRAEGNYFLVQDGKADQEYAVAMAFAAKEHNYATLHVTVETASGDIPASVDWSVSGDNGYSQTGITSSDWTAVVSGDANYTFTFPQYAGYTVSPETTSRDIKWGGSADIKVLYSQIHAESVSLDKTAATLDYRSAASHDVLTLTATISPDKTLDKTVSWATSDTNIAEVDQSGNVTPTGKGKATITASAEGKTASCDVTVIQRIDSAVITVSASEVYTGGEIKPGVTVTLGGTALNAENYEVSYTDNTNVGTATVTVKGTAANYYGGEANAAFAITAKPITVTPSAGQSKTYGATEPVFAYSSSETGATFTGALARETGDNVGTYAYTLGSLSAGTNYTLTLNNNADKFKITQKDASAFTVTTISADIYDGKAKTPELTVMDGETKLVKDKDYTVSYSDNTNAGTATATANFTGNYAGTKSVTFKITPKKTTLTIDPIADQTYTGGAIKPAVTVKDGETALKDTDYTLSWANNVKIGTATVTATGKGNYEGSTGSAPFRVIPIVAPSDVTERTRTDGDNSGILPITDGTTEDFAIFDAMRELANAGKLAAGISYDAKALAATSADIVTSEDLFSAEQIKSAVAEYWDLGGDSENKVRLVEIQNTVASRAGEGETILAKFWKMLVSLFKTNNGEDAFSEGDYLPVQANFTIRSGDIAALPDEIKEGLTKDNLLSRINLFTVVKETSGDIYARSLADAASGDKAAYITVTGDSANGYAVKTRVMLFDMEGGLSGDKTTGAKWVQPLKVSSSDQRTNDKDNYFIVQDGAKDTEYKLCLAFAAKEANNATVSLTTSGDIESKDIDYVRWAISGDAAQHEADSSADIKGGKQSVTLGAIPTKYHVTLSDETQTLSRDMTTITKDVAWGGAWKITALIEKIKAETVTLDKTALVLAPGGSDKLTATVTPDDAYAKDIAWTTSDENIAEIAADGTVTAKAAGKATITATANDGGGASAACAVTVRNNAGDDPTAPSLTPELVTHAIARPAEIELADNTASYVTDAAKQTTVATAAGFLDEDTALTETGALAAGSTVVNGAVNDVIAKDPTVSKDIVYALPVVESKADKAGMLHAISFKVSGDIFGEVTGAEIRVLKVFPDGTGELFTPISAPEEIADKTAALYDTNEAMVTGAIDKEGHYILTVFVKDGESFDLDGKADGTVIDPVSIIKAAAAEPDEPDNTRSHNGGCSTGAALPLLAAMAAVLIIRKKR